MNVITVIEKLKADDVMTLAIEQVESAVFLQNLKFKRKKICFGFGTEVHGVSQEQLPYVMVVLKFHN
jgi:hypothetical protein